MNQETIDKLRRCFECMAVYKDLRNNSVFSSLSLPSFMRDWLLQRFEDSDGVFDAKELDEFVKKYLPKPSEWENIKNRIVNEYENVKLLAKIAIRISIETGEVSFALPDFGLTNKQTIVQPEIWRQCQDQLLTGSEVWGMIELGYLPSKDGKEKGRIRLVSFQNFCPYEIDLECYKDIRAEFTIKEWIDLLLGAIDYNADGYDVVKANNPAMPDVEIMKHTMLTRLLPFVEKRLNLMELAPPGTGKSYVFGQISRYIWLSTSNRMTRAKLFYDIGKREPGLMTHNDAVVLDEIQKTVFEDGMGATMQGYLEQGKFTVGSYSGQGTAGLMLCGNIPTSVMNADGYQFMFGNLPKLFQDVAMIDRFHGFIKGWNIPRTNDDLKARGWALNTEYFTAIMHELRDDLSYRTIVDELIELPSGADTRDTEAIKRVCTALLKLLFPNVRQASQIMYHDFYRYCFQPALQMRFTIKYQMGLMDISRHKDLGEYKVRRICDN